ncbi:MAG: NAD-binding protein [Planctomycetaceae bacterium]
MKIIVVGGGRVVYFLSRSFTSKGHSVTIVSRDAEECQWFARRLKATIILGDGSFPRILDDAGADNADLVLAITPRDEDNLIICQIAERRFGVPRTVAVVSDPDNETVFPKLGVKNVVSITRILSTLIEEQAGVEELTNLLALAEGRVNIAELELTKECPVLGLPLAEITLPESALIACVLRGKDVIVPHGATTLSVGDRVVLVTVPETHGKAVRMLTGEA